VIALVLALVGFVDTVQAAVIVQALAERPRAGDNKVLVIGKDLVERRFDLHRTVADRLERESAVASQVPAVRISDPWAWVGRTETGEAIEHLLGSNLLAGLGASRLVLQEEAVAASAVLWPMLVRP
jgi:hypothetical protein